MTAGSCPTSTRPSVGATAGGSPSASQVRLIPAHVDPTVAYHERLHVLDGEEVVDEWPVDLRGW